MSFWRAEMIGPIWRKLCATFVFLTIAVLCVCAEEDYWKNGIKPRSTVDIRRLFMSSFPASNQVEKDESFRLLSRDDDHVIIGGQNAMYKLTVAGLSEVQEERIEWRSESKLMSHCQYLGKAPSECHNYIRIYSRSDKDTVKLCGTNSYQPQCRLFKLTQNGTEAKPDTTSSANALCPFSPKEHSTFVEADGQLYSGSSFRSGSNKTLIYREPLSTVPSNFHQLNDAEFVESFEYKDHVYFFFREMSTEKGINGKMFLSRVGRVCKNDKGWSSSKWTTFVKARLACKIPGDFSFYLNMLHSVFRVRTRLFSPGHREQEDVVYTVFGTQPNSIIGHAVCAFRMHDIEQVFLRGFRSTDTQTAEEPPVTSLSTPWTVGSCTANSSDQLNADQVSFVLRHSLAAEEVHSVSGRPLVASSSVEGGAGYRLRQVAVVPGVTSIDERLYDVVYLSTDDGRLLKAVVGVENASTAVFSSHVVWRSSVVALGTITRLLPSPDLRQMLVVSDHQLMNLKLSFNWLPQDSENSCTGCLALADPEYGWDVTSRSCVYVQDSVKHFGILQNVTHGWHPMCRAGRPRSENTYSSAPVKGGTTPLNTSPSTMAQRDIHCERSSSTLATAIVCSSLLTLVIGLAVGWLLAYLTSKHRKPDRKLDRKSTGSYGNSVWVADTLLKLCGSGVAPSPESVKSAQANKADNLIYNKATLCENNVAKDVNLHIDRQNMELSKNIKTPSTGSASPQKVRKVYI